MGSGHERTIKAKKNVLISVFLKGLGVLIGFAYFPISLSYLSPANFGIFLTLTSMIDWFAELDIGIGNGLRNRVGEAVAKGDDESVKGYVSTAYVVLGSIFASVSVLFIIASYFIPWSDVLQAEPNMNYDIMVLAIMMFGAFAIRFISSLVYQMLYALQQMAWVEFFSFLTKVSFLIVIIGLVYFTDESLILFGVAKTMTFALVPFFVGLVYFSRSFKKYTPSFSHVKRKYFNGLFSIGIQFFIIELSMLVIFQTNNFLIARFVALEEVPVYEAANKYMSVFILLFVILSNQLWAANVEAFSKGEIGWVKSTMKNVQKIWLGTIGIMILMIMVSPWVYWLWLKETLSIPLILTITVAVSIALTNWINMFNIVLNGAGKVRLQMYGWLFASIMNIPCSIFFSEYLGYGTIGIVLGTIVCMVPLLIITPLQVNRILAGTDKGIWAK